MVYDPYSLRMLERRTAQTMEEKTTQLAHRVREDATQVPRTHQQSLPTPQQFYKKLVEREDIRAILKRLANN